MRLILLTLFILINLEAKSLFSNNNQADNSIYVGALKDLIIATQKTRGLTNSYLNGNTVAMLLVYTSRDNMKKAIGVMESLPLAADPVINKRATSISQSLIKLNNKAFSLKPSVTFSKYTEEIEQALMLAQTVNKRTSKDLNPFGKEASEIMMQTMLPMSEYVGQLRGFGAGLAAKGSANKQELEKIYVLAQKVNNLNSQLDKQMQELQNKYPNKLPSILTTSISSLNNQAKDYSKYALDRFKNNPKSIDADGYFDRGTQLISSIIKIYDATNQALLEDSKGWL
ncbi:nitrate- and nitrite sensing domain-containing protein [Sulfurimonas autotrophica]|uniref:Nitrate/nitrite sensing protein domain-containing protein n=1 Tax=Sulfurimonas autotrophica (strain ATCC BAA-671 / DSM 16294 / JCM 11897 / OK10) TaxID=563040 RepID=E0UUG8_SULAO|nr:nitrate- and nitrite sensing domain-containing protein [Sulfurimonas autotrophica]ADN08404.1 hypothetical protein Saut_0355 [Sulfurimonas autotrophica DSM 16294]